MLRMQRAEPPYGTIAAPDARRLTRVQRRMLLRRRSGIARRAPVSASSASTSAFTSKKSTFVASTPHCSGSAEPATTPAITSVSAPSCRRSDARLRTDARAVADAADCCRVPAASRATATRASPPSSAEIGFASANAGSGNSSACAAGIGERVSDRFLIAAIDEQIRCALVAHASLGPRLHALRARSRSARECCRSRTGARLPRSGLLRC